MASRLRKVRPRSARRKRAAVAPVAVSPGDVARLGSRWPWVRMLALKRAQAAAPLSSAPQCLELIVNSLASPWTRNAARKALVTWLPLVSNRGGLRLGDRQVVLLRQTTRRSLPYRHASFVVAALGALARMDDVESRSVAEQFLTDAVQVPTGAAPAHDPWGGLPQSFWGTQRWAQPYDQLERFSQVRRAAGECLQHLNVVQEQRLQRGVLVSPADPPTDVLLRPANPGTPGHDPTLVRPASPPEPNARG